MGKRGSNKSRTSRQPGAISSTIARRSLPRLIPVYVGLPDRRTHVPDRHYQPPTAGKRYATKIQADNRRNTRTKRTRTGLVASINFRAPRSVHICQRRSARRQVMHALNIAGRKGVGKGKRRRTNFWSRVGCHS